jgi:hypothetical protein
MMNCLTTSEKIGIWKMGATAEYNDSLSFDSFLVLKNIYLDSTEEEREELYNISCTIVYKVKDYIKEQEEYLNAEETE